MDVIKAGAVLAATGAAPALAAARKPKPGPRVKAPLAITMWDFSWLERRWPGAGYENWDVALDELVERGYNAVRIDAYPHLVARGPHREWTLKPNWNTQDWGSPDYNRVVVLPALLEFIGKCRRRHIKVGLSSWYREDVDNTRMKISGPHMMAQEWADTIGHIERAGLLDAILYVDLCNEWPLDVWSPFFKTPATTVEWAKPESLAYIRAAIGHLRAAYPMLPMLFSFTNERVEDYLDHKPPFDLYDHHIWMSGENDDEFYKEVGYAYERFDPKGYTNMSLKAEPAYRARPAYWHGLLHKKIARAAQVSAQMNVPLIITECWSVVDYKDWPLLKWDWIKDLCADGVRTSSRTGQWAAIATSNFCGPQFRGMWRDVRWHQEQTSLIRSGKIASGLRSGRLWDRL